MQFTNTLFITRLNVNYKSYKYVKINSARNVLLVKLLLQCRTKFIISNWLFGNTSRLEITCKYTT